MGNCGQPEDGLFEEEIVETFEQKVERVAVAIFLAKLPHRTPEMWEENRALHRIYRRCAVAALEEEAREIEEE
jgi:hypothetical protein